MPRISGLRDALPLLIYIAGVAALLGSLAFGRWTCATSECEQVCTANGDAPVWTWTQGCYCSDGSGLYNPQDSRDRAPSERR